MPSVLTAQPKSVSSNTAHGQARYVCAVPLLFVFLFDWTRTGEILEGIAVWVVLVVVIGASAAKFLKNTDPQMLKLVLMKAGKIAAGVLVGTAVQKGWLTPDAQNETTAKLTEIFVEVGLFVAGVVWVHKDTKRELNAVSVEQERTEIALQLPADATREDVEAIRARIKERTNPKEGNPNETN